jgi:hypothetical protein
MAFVAEYRLSVIGSFRTLSGLTIPNAHNLRMVLSDFTLAAAGSAQILDANPRRLWALITNNTLDWTRIIFAATGTYALSGHRFDIGGSILINELMPWPGAVVAYSPAGSAGATLTVTDVTVDE